MNKALKGTLAGLLVVTTGPFGLVAIGIYLLRKNREELQAQTRLLNQINNTPSIEEIK